MLHPSPVKTNPHTRESLPKESPRQWGGKYQFEIIMDVRNDGHLILHRRADHVAVESFSQVGNKFPIIPGDVVTSVNNRSVELMQYDEVIDAVFRNPLGLSAIRFVRPVKGRVHVSVRARIGHALRGKGGSSSTSSSPRLDEMRASAVDDDDSAARGGGGGGTGATGMGAKTRASGSEDSLHRDSVGSATSEDASSDGGSAIKGLASSAGIATASSTSSTAESRKRTHSRAARSDAAPANASTASSTTTAAAAAAAAADAAAVRDHKRARSL